MNYSNLKVGDKVKVSGFNGVVIRLCEWDKDQELIEIRLRSGDKCISSTEVERI